MASLTPGVLVKLQQSMDTEAKDVGEHHTAVLQVIGIVPTLSASSAEDLRPSHGFYNQLSDSAHSTYVLLSDADADDILSKRPQLGQLVHVVRLHFAHTVPRASGVRPLPDRTHPFLGSPEPLITHSDTSRRGFVIQPASPADDGPPLIPSFSALKSNPFSEENTFGEKRTVFAAKEKPAGEKRTVFAAEENFICAANKAAGETACKRRHEEEQQQDREAEGPIPCCGKGEGGFETILLCFG